MPTILLPVPHIKQHHQADCLAACAAMALAFVNVNATYDSLLRLLKVKSFGAAGQNLKYLTSLGVDVIYREGSIEELKEYLENEHPCIALVRTADLSYWAYATDHAVLVRGFDEKNILVNDPMFDHTPIAIPISEFELAWISFDYRFGLIKKMA